MSALAGDAVTDVPTSASANDAQTNASAAITTRKNLDSIDDEVDALSEIGASGAICKGAMRKIRDSAEPKFYGEEVHPYLHPEIWREIEVNALCSALN